MLPPTTYSWNTDIVSQCMLPPTTYSWHTDIVSQCMLPPTTYLWNTDIVSQCMVPPTTYSWITDIAKCSWHMSTLEKSTLSTQLFTTSDNFQEQFRLQIVS